MGPGSDDGRPRDEFGGACLRIGAVAIVAFALATLLGWGLSS